jgi:GDPmannose 4,6-dehydratase
MKERIMVCTNKVDMLSRWSGSGVDEKGSNSATDAVIVKIDREAYLIRERTNNQVGDPSDTRTKLGWQRKRSFKVIHPEGNVQSQTNYVSRIRSKKLPEKCTGEN